MSNSNLYKTVPFYRRNGLMTIIGAIGIVFVPLLWIVSLVCITGPVYINKIDEKTNKLQQWGILGKIFVIFLTCAWTFQYNGNIKDSVIYKEIVYGLGINQNPLIEDTSKDLVTELLIKRKDFLESLGQAFPYSVKCTKVTLGNKDNDDRYDAIATLSDGQNIKVLVTVIGNKVHVNLQNK